jgi:hypothetical protein
VLEHWLGICLSECPSWYKHPELTVSVHAGLEIAAKGNVLADTDDVCEVVRLLIDMGADVNAVGEEESHCQPAGTVFV